MNYNILTHINKIQEIMLQSIDNLQVIQNNTNDKLIRSKIKIIINEQIKSINLIGELYNE